MTSLFCKKSADINKILKSYPVCKELVKNSIFSFVSAVALDKLLEVEEISDTFEGMLKYVQNAKKEKSQPILIHRFR